MSTPIIPLFSSSSSLKQGGIWTCEKAGASAKAGHTRGPLSLCDLAKDEKLTRLHLVESNFVSFMTAHKNLAAVGCDLAFGLKVVVCEDIADKSEASFKSESKVVIFLRDDRGYAPLIKLYSRAATDGFYYLPRLDWRSLRAGWNDHLILALPFYSSFIARNTLTFSAIVPDLPTTPVVMSEVDQQLPYDSLLHDAVGRYAAANTLPLQPTKSVYYRDRKDAKQWLIDQCILQRKTWDVPPDGVTSREFSWQAYRELVASAAVTTPLT